MLKPGIHEDMPLPGLASAEPLLSRILEPKNLGKRKLSGKDVKITIPVHVVEIVSIVLHVILTERFDAPELDRFPSGVKIIMLARHNVQVAIFVQVAHGAGFGVVLVKQLGFEAQSCRDEQWKKQE